MSRDGEAQNPQHEGQEAGEEEGRGKVNTHGTFKCIEGVTRQLTALIHLE